MQLTEFQRSLISRAAMAVLGLALLYGSLACFRTANDLATDAAEQRQSAPQTRATGSPLPFMAGVVLALVGVPFVLGAVLPHKLLYKIPFLAEPDTGREEIESLIRRRYP